MINQLIVTMQINIIIIIINEIITSRKSRQNIKSKISNLINRRFFFHFKAHFEDQKKI